MEILGNENEAVATSFDLLLGVLLQERDASAGQRLGPPPDCGERGSGISPMNDTQIHEHIEEPGRRGTSPARARRRPHLDGRRPAAARSGFRCYSINIGICCASGARGAMRARIPAVAHVRDEEIVER